MALAGALWINDRDVAELGITTEGADNVLGALRGGVDTAPMAGASGVAIAGLDLNMERRAVSVRVTVDGDTQADYVSKVEQIAYLCMNGTLELRTAHDPNYVLLCTWRGHTLPVFPPQWVNVSGRGELLFETVVPYFVERVPRCYAITTAGNTGRIQIPSGSGPTLYVLRPRGSATNPKFTLLDDLHTPLAELQCNVTLGTADYLGLDGLTRRIAQSTAGVESWADSILRPGDRWFVLRPQLGQWAAGTSHWLELSAGKAWVMARRTKRS